MQCKEDKGMVVLQGSQTPQRKVKFKVESRCSPRIGVDILRYLLETPHCQALLLKRHLVPLFQVWKALLRTTVCAQRHASPLSVP